RFRLFSLFFFCFRPLSHVFFRFHTFLLVLVRFSSAFARFADIRAFWNSRVFAGIRAFSSAFAHFRQLSRVYASFRGFTPALAGLRRLSRVSAGVRAFRLAFARFGRRSRVKACLRAFRSASDVCFGRLNSIIESRDVIFDEERFTSIPRPRGMIRPTSSKIAKDEVEGIDDLPGLFIPRKTNRTRKDKSFGSNFQLSLVEGTRDKALSQREYCFIIEEDPRTLSEAMAFRDVAF
nr:zinc finger, CCHC-type [Tanacetum cinerariifolium]